tara:strand:- start:40182 stop:41621 length:1440 start_codon:yes stop_codon:yes gene_type:complete
MKKESIIPVIICGGSGTRLWPISRQSFPKQFLPLGINQNKSLLQNTFARIRNLENICNPILVCNEEHRFIAAEQMREINIKPTSILLEPFGRNTAPAIALSSLIALENFEDPTLIVLSADHEIKNNDKFIKILEKGINESNKDNLITFGVVPTHPETGYGYIKAEKPFISNDIVSYKISKFLEKPNLEKAKQLILDKRYSWNSGIFIFKAKNIINELKKYSPTVINSCESALGKREYDLDFQRLNKKDFEKCPNVSIDIAVMEKTDKGVVIPLDVGWSDIGSWESVWELSQKNENQNVIKGKVILDNCEDCLAKSEHRLIAGIGLKNLIIIETSDSILISKKNETQRVKEIVSKLKEKNFIEGTQHRKIYRPWGYYISIIEESRWQVKQISVKAGERLSLQMHHHRSEHWIVVKGTAKVEVNNSTKILAENQSTYIPLGSKHRLSNPGKIPLILIEVQSGSYVGEDDIVRFEDNYGRIN